MVTPEGPAPSIVPTRRACARRDAGRRRPARCWSAVDCRGAVGDVALLLERDAVRQGDPMLGYDVGFYVFQLPFWSWCTLAGDPAPRARDRRRRPTSYSAPCVLRAERAARYPAAAACVTSRCSRRAAWRSLAFGAWLAHPRAADRRRRASFTARPTSTSTPAAGAAAAAWWRRSWARCWPCYQAIAERTLAARDRRRALRGRCRSAAPSTRPRLQRFVVAPNEQVRETPFIVHNIAATRARLRARATSRSASCRATRLLTRRRHRRATRRRSSNVPLWDHQPLLDTFGQIQEIRTYYDFVSVDNDRYMINGEYRQIMLSARELNSASLPNRTWINERLTFTHGYGLTLGPGQPGDARRACRCCSSRTCRRNRRSTCTVTEPSIYFGELSNDHVFVKTQARKEFHYPKGDDNVYTSYDGRRAACRVDGLVRGKLLFAHPLPLDEDAALATTSRPRAASSSTAASPSASRRIAPFLDLRPRPVPGDRRRAGCSGSRTPTRPATATRTRRQRARRHQLHPQLGQGRRSTPTTARPPSTWSTRRDPIAATLGRHVPGPAAARSARCPRACARGCATRRGIFALQAAMFSTYHMTNPAVFYNKEDQWEVPAIDDAGRRGAAMQPYYTIMKLPGESAARSSSRCCRSRRGRRTTWRPGWWRAATASTTASSSCSSSRSRR